MRIEGVQLSLLMGPSVPLPVPRPVLDALRGVEVTAATEGPSGFQLSFALEAGSPLNTLLLVAGALLPDIRVVLTAIVNGLPHVLMDGVVTRQEVSAGDEPGVQTLMVTGEDLTALMDRQELDGMPYPALPPEGRVAAILARYALYGIVPMILPGPNLDVPNPTERIPLQHGTDLAYLRELAEETGGVFYVEPGPLPGMNLAYFGPRIGIGVPQPALTHDPGPAGNVESLSFNYQSQDRAIPVAFVENPQTHIPIPVPLPGFNPLDPPLAATPFLPKRAEFLNDTARLSLPAALSRLMSRAAQSADSVRVSGSLDVPRYGWVLKSRKLVGVRGGGLAFDGLYRVESVTTTLKRGEFKQRFSLARNGLVSLTQAVPVY